MINESYIRPVDRPSVIWCRTCAKYKDAKPGTRKNGSKWPPTDLKTWYCIDCGEVTGSMVYQYEVADPVLPEAWKPKCGNSSCDGMCDNALCIPPEYQLQKVVYEKQVEIVKQIVFLKAGI